MFHFRIQKNFGRLIALSLAACLLLGLVGCRSTGSSEIGNAGSRESESIEPRESRDTEPSGNGSAELSETGSAEPSRNSKRVVAGRTPEETMETFFKALSRQDVDTMLACCYIEDYFDRVSFVQFVDRIQSYNLQIDISAPAEYDYYRDLLIERRRGRLAQYFETLTFSLLTTDLEEYEHMMDQRPILADGDWAVDFSRMANPKALADLKVLSIDENCPELQNRPQNKEVMSKNSGADDCVERTALLELNGALFYKGFTLAEVDGRWQIYLQNALLLGENTYGGATQVKSVGEYQRIIQ